MNKELLLIAACLLFPAYRDAKTSLTIAQMLWDEVQKLNGKNAMAPSDMGRGSGPTQGGG